MIGYTTRVREQYNGSTGNATPESVELDCIGWKMKTERHHDAESIIRNNAVQKL